MTTHEWTARWDDARRAIWNAERAASGRWDGDTTEARRADAAGGTTMPLNIACSSEEQVPVTASPVTASGRPARLDGALTVTVQSGDGTVSQDPGSPLVFKAVSGDGPGDTVYVVTGDADLGAGVVSIQDTVTLTVSGANAAAFGLTGGAAEPKP